MSAPIKVAKELTKILISREAISIPIWYSYGNIGADALTLKSDG